MREMSAGMKYTMERKELRDLLLSTGGTRFWMGTLYDIKSKSLGAGVYNVWLQEPKAPKKKV